MEGSVSMQPDGVAELVHYGNEVLVQAGAGEGSGFSDGEYDEAGARVVEGPEEVFEAAALFAVIGGFCIVFAWRVRRIGRARTYHYWSASWWADAL